MSAGAPLLDVNISVDYRNKPGVLSDVRFEIRPGERFALAGRGGCGKSTVAMAVLGLLEMRGGTVRGSIRFEGRELAGCGERQMRALRGSRIALIPQSPQSALNPVLRLETHFREAWSAHSRIPWREERPRLLETLESLGLPPDEGFLRRYPHQISVGQSQRVMIAMAVLHRPSLLIADEPTSALDAESARDILHLLRDLNREFGMAMLYISHDMQSVGELCTRMAALRDGRIAECAEVAPLR